MRFALGQIPATSFQVGSTQLREAALGGPALERMKRKGDHPTSPAAKRGLPGAL